MARSVALIQSQIKTTWAATTELAAANSTSATAIWNLITYIVAVAIAFHEQLIDAAKIEVEQIAASGIPGTEPWVQDQVFRFQYHATIPQVVSLVNFVPTYAVPDPTLRIITQCAVKTNVNNIVSIKVATASGVLSGPELAALTAYLMIIMPAGVRYTIVNLVADKLAAGGVIFYNGQYASVISANVIAAIRAYLAALPFNGIFKLSDMEAAILAVEGISDVNLAYVKARADATVFASAYNVYNLATGINNRVWNTVSGSLVEETTVGETFTDQLIFTIA